MESKTEDQGSCLPPKPLEAVVERALEMMLEALGLNLHFALTEAMSQMGTVSASRVGFVSQMSSWT